MQIPERIITNRETMMKAAIKKSNAEQYEDALLGAHVDLLGMSETVDNAINNIEIDEDVTDWGKVGSMKAALELLGQARQILEALG